MAATLPGRQLAILDVLLVHGRKINAAAVAKQLGCNHQTVRDQLISLRNMGLVHSEDDGKGRWFHDATYRGVQYRACLRLAISGWEQCIQERPGAVV